MPTPGSSPSGKNVKKAGTKRRTWRRKQSREVDTKEEQSKESTKPRRKGTACTMEEDPSQHATEKKKGRSKLVARQDKFTATPEVDAACQEFVDHHRIETVREEFRLVSEMPTEEDKHKDCCQHKERNRYEGIPCYDATRIKISQDIAGGGCDFIHANKVTYEKADRDYILAQAPMQNTVEEFWRMVFQENSTSIVVLCAFYEKGRESSEAFWPLKDGEYKYYGKMFINTKKVEQRESTPVYTLEVLPDGCSNSIITTIYHVTTWEAGSALNTRTIPRVRNYLKAGEKGPLTVVSSEGINRAACFTAIDICLARLFKGLKTRMLELAQHIRKCRAKAFNETAISYLFAVQCCLEYIRLKIKKHTEALNKYNTGIKTVV